MFKLILFLLCLVLNCNADQLEDECGLEGTFALPLVKYGQVPNQHEFPWHVAVFDSAKGFYRLECGGSLVRSDLVISAAHCFSYNTSYISRWRASKYWIVAGTKSAFWTSRGLYKQTSQVRDVLLVEAYRGNEGYFYGDIAIVQLVNSFHVSDMVRTICLNLANMGMDLFQGFEGKVAGWGLTELGTSSDTLKYLQIPVIDDRQCIGQVPQTYSRYLIQDKICAGLTHGPSMCQGDSGGGLVFQYNGRWHLRGVLSSAPNFDFTDSPYVTCLKTTVTLYTNIFEHSFWLSTKLEELHQPETTCSSRGSIGVCRYFYDCPTAMSSGRQPTRCPNFDPAERVICCVGQQAETRKQSNGEWFNEGGGGGRWALEETHSPSGSRTTRLKTFEMLQK